MFSSINRGWVQRRMPCVQGNWWSSGCLKARGVQAEQVVVLEMDEGPRTEDEG